jgi:hypothetical protein
MPRNNDDNEPLFSPGTDTQDPTAGMTPQQVAQAVAKLLELPPEPPSRSLVHEAALRSNGPVQGNSGAQASINDDLSRFDDALKNTAR